MGAGNSKTQGLNENLQMLQSPQDQTFANDGQTEQSIDAGDKRASQSSKRRHGCDSDAAKSNKRLKRSNNSDSFEQDVRTDICQSSASSLETSDHHNVHPPVDADAPTQDSPAETQADIHHAIPTCHPSSILGMREDGYTGRLEPTGASTSLRPQDTVHDMSLDNDQPPESAQVLCFSSADLGRQSDVESPGRKGAISPCASTSELSQQMESQLSQASQAIVEAASASRDLEGAATTFWKGASAQFLSRTQREQNRQLLREAIRELHIIKDSEGFAVDGMARSAPRLVAAAYSRRRPHSGDDADEVNFVVEAGDPLGAFRSTQRPRHATCESHADTDALRSTIYIEGFDNDGDQHMPGPSARQDSGSGRRQRKLVGYWKGWEEGVFSRQAMV